MRTLAVLVLLSPLIALLEVTSPTSACSGSPELIEDPVRAADVIAVVRAETVGGAVNAAPTIQPTFRPPPEATVPPFGLADLTGIGATVYVTDSIAGTYLVGERIAVDGARRAELEADERTNESVWPNMAVSNCALQFQFRYEPEATYVALYEWTGVDYETQRLLKLDGDNLDPSHNVIGLKRGIAVSLATYEQHFADIDADISDGVPDEYDYAYIARPAMPVARFLSFIRSVRGERISPPETGSAGLRGTR